MHALLSLCITITQPPALAQPSIPRTLAEALANAPWDPAERGVLLVVGAEQVRFKTPPPPPPPRGYNLKELARSFDRLLVPVGNLTVVAPSTMRVLIKPASSPEEASWKNPDEALRALLASLSKAQWQTLGSDNGLGLNDLQTEKQRGMFLASLPDPLQLQPVPAIKRERTEQGQLRFRSEPLPAGMVPITLTPAQRSSVRIRLNRSLQFMFAAEGGDGNSLSGGGGMGMAGQDKARYQLANAFRRADPQAGIQDLPNRQKPSDLDFASLRGVVSLTGATTLGELVQRAAKVSGKELYADPRVASLSVRVWGESATSGDLLAALCRAVTGTFRRVGDAYVLTHDREGLTALGEPMRLWQSTVERLKEARRKEQEKAIRKENPADLIGFSSGDPLQLPSEQLRQLDAERRAGYTGKPIGLSVSDLPTSVQQAVKEQIKQMHEDIAAGRMSVSHNGQTVTTFRSDKVWPRFELKLAYLIPNLGAVPRDSFNGIYNLQGTLFERDYSAPPPTEPAKTPPSALIWPAGERVALVSARTPDEAKALAQAARAGGLSLLWLKVPLNVARAAALITAAQSVGIAVGAAVSAFDAPADALPTGATPDLTAAGLTSDLYAQRWLPLQDPQTTERIVRYDDAVLLALSQLARLPKLASLYFTDLVPPGYQKQNNREAMMFFSAPRLGDFGYTLDNRLAFLRQTGCDPIDSVPPPSYNSDTTLPFFPPFGMMNRPNFIRQPDGTMVMQPPSPNVYQKWQEFRAAQNAAFLPRIFTHLKQAAPQLPLYAAGEGPFLWAGSWDKPELRPGFSAPMQGFDFSNKMVLPQVRKASQRVFNSATGHPKMSVDALKGNITFNATDYPNWDGILLRLSELPVPQTVALLKGLGEGKQLP